MRASPVRNLHQWRQMIFHNASLGFTRSQHLSSHPSPLKHHYAFADWRMKQQLTSLDAAESKSLSLATGQSEQKQAAYAWHHTYQWHTIFPATWSKEVW